MCWACRAIKDVREDSGKERITSSALNELYKSRVPAHQHEWYFASRSSDRGVENTVNSHYMANVTEEEHAAFIRRASLDELMSFEKLVSSTSDKDQKKAVDMIRNTKK